VSSRHRYLLIQLRQLGDILLTTPCVNYIRRLDPDAHISFLTHKMGSLIIDQNPFVDEHLCYSDDGVWSEISFLNSLRKKRYDTVFDFMNNPRSALYTLSTRARNRISFRSSRSWAYNSLVERDTKPQYIVEEKLRMLDHFFGQPAVQDAERQKLTLPWSSENLTVTDKFFSTHPEFKEDRIRIVLSPTHRREIRQWPLESYASIADYLVEKWGALVTWIWGPGIEESQIEQVMNLCQKKTYKAPKTSFRELTAFIANNDLFVGNSNGPSHVAVATDTASLQLHGHTLARSWCPLTNRHRAIQSPEGQLNPDSAMKAISVDQVIAELESMKSLLASRKNNQVIQRNTWNSGVEHVPQELH